MSNGSETGNVYLNGFVVMSFEDFIRDAQIKSTHAIMQKLLYSAYTATPDDVSSLVITAAELNTFFAGNKLSTTEHYRGIPLKITVYTVSKAIAEWGFLWHDKGVGTAPSAGFYAWLISQTDLVEAPTGVRTVESITYDGTARTYTINFAGTLNALGNVVIDLF